MMVVVVMMVVMMVVVVPVLVVQCRAIQCFELMQKRVAVVVVAASVPLPVPWATKTVRPTVASRLIPAPRIYNHTLKLRHPQKRVRQQQSTIPDEPMQHWLWTAIHWMYLSRPFDVFECWKLVCCWRHFRPLKRWTQCTTVSNSCHQNETKQTHCRQG